MKAGNANYSDVDDIPAVVPVFPLSGALLLPGSQLPLNLFEPRYLSMFDTALKSNRVVGMVQPAFSGDLGRPEKPNLCKVGCLGRITAYSETGDGRYLITLEGICRYRIIEELDVTTPFRQCRIAPFASDLADDELLINVIEGATAALQQASAQAWIACSTSRRVPTTTTHRRRPWDGKPCGSIGGTGVSSVTRCRWRTKPRSLPASDRCG